MTSAEGEFVHFPREAFELLLTGLLLAGLLAKAESDRFCKPSNQEDRLRRLDEALRPALKLEAYLKVHCLPGGGAVTPLQ